MRYRRRYRYSAVATGQNPGRPRIAAPNGRCPALTRFDPFRRFQRTMPCASFSLTFSSASTDNAVCQLGLTFLSAPTDHAVRQLSFDPFIGPNGQRPASGPVPVAPNKLGAWGCGLVNTTSASWSFVYRPRKRWFKLERTYRLAVPRPSLEFLGPGGGQSARPPTKTRERAVRPFHRRQRTVPCASLV